MKIHAVGIRWRGERGMTGAPHGCDRAGGDAVQSGVSQRSAGRHGVTDQLRTVMQEMSERFNVRHTASA